jgi:hypothetical protein
MEFLHLNERREPQLKAGRMPDVITRRPTRLQDAGEQGHRATVARTGELNVKWSVTRRIALLPQGTLFAPPVSAMPWAPEGHCRARRVAMLSARRLC